MYTKAHHGCTTLQTGVTLQTDVGEGEGATESKTSASERRRRRRLRLSSKMTARSCWSCLSCRAFAASPLCPKDSPPPPPPRSFCVSASSSRVHWPCSTRLDSACRASASATAARSFFSSIPARDAPLRMLASASASASASLPAAGCIPIARLLDSALELGHACLRCKRVGESEGEERRGREEEKVRRLRDSLGVQIWLTLRLRYADTVGA
jgi:hypothetical protein